jgi:hypothetical protein
MLCEHYKDAVIETAAGAVPQDELRGHLAECASCRAALAEEQSFFAAIDTGLHAAANTEVPPSLLPRVRVALGQETPLKSAWFSDALVLATAAAIVVTFFAVRALRQPKGANDGRDRVNTAIKTVAPLLKPTLPQEHMRNPEPKLNSSSSPPSLIARNSSGPRPIVTTGALPEVLVPRDQDALLVSYAEQWYRRKRAPLVAGDVADSTLEPLQVAAIQITQLDVKPLAAENSQ